MNFTAIRKNIRISMGKLFGTGFFHVFGSTVINKILAFLSSMIIVRIVSKAEYGVYASGLNQMSMFLLVGALGMLSGVLQVCSEKVKYPEESLKTFRYGSSIGIQFNFVLGLIIIIASLFMPEKIHGTNEILRMIAFIPFIEIINEFQKIYFRSTLNNKYFAYANTISTALVVLFSVSGATLYSVKGLIFGRYLAAVCSLLFTKYILKGPVYITRGKFVYREKKLLFNISLISMANNGLSSLLTLVDVFVITLLTGEASSVADYKVAIIIPTALGFIPGAVCTYVYPYFSMHLRDRKWLVSKYAILFKAMLIANMLITITMIICAPLIIKAFAGSKYMSAVGMFRIASISYFFEGTFRTVAGNLLVSQRKLKFNFFMSLSAGILNIISNYILVSKYGAIGAAWTTLIITAGSGILATIYLIKVFNNIKTEEVN